MSRIHLYGVLGWKYYEYQLFVAVFKTSSCGHASFCMCMYCMGAVWPERGYTTICRSLWFVCHSHHSLFSSNLFQLLLLSHNLFSSLETSSLMTSSLVLSLSHCRPRARTYCTENRIAVSHISTLATEHGY